MNATKEKVFVCWYKKKANEKRREKGPPKICTFLPPHRFKKTNFTILIILRNTSVYSQTLTHIYISFLSSRYSLGSGRVRSEKKATTTRLKSLRGVAASFFFPIRMSSLIRVFSPLTTTGTTTREPLSKLFYI